MTGSPSGEVILKVKVPAVLAVSMVAAGTSVNPNCDADSPSPASIGSVIPGMLDIVGAVDAADTPGVVLVA
ncbi:hypothetical protein AAHS21_31315 [Mycobacterium sp. 050272]|uniref:hypothetical protein n=1 Tax=Mycobacterium sp. 050272 TaxID=3142488 RepID=UPI00318A50F8